MTKIPNIVHFIFGVTSDAPGRRFTFIHYLAVVTAWAANRPERIILHCQYEPFGIWWDRVRPFLEVNRVDAPAEVFGNPVSHPAHKADVLRLRILSSMGGIYLDTDALCVCSIAPLLIHDVVLARQGEQGLGNGVILAAQGASFIERWRESYRDFDGRQWGEHSIRRPWLLAHRYPEEITIIDEKTFFFPLTIDPPHVLWTSRRESLRDPEVRHETRKRIKRHLSKTLRFKRRKVFNPPLRHFLRSEGGHLRQLKRSYSVHLWNQSWRETYLKAIDPAYVLDQNNNFARIVAYAVRDTDIMSRLADYAREDAGRSKSK